MYYEGCLMKKKTKFCRKIKLKVKKNYYMKKNIGIFKRNPQKL